MGIQAVVFDMDGVLIDSEPIYHKNHRALHARLGIPYTEQIALDFTGLNAADSGEEDGRAFSAVRHHRSPGGGSV